VTIEPYVLRDAAIHIEIIKQAIKIFEADGTHSTSRVPSDLEYMNYWKKKGGGILIALQGVDYEWEEYLILRNHEIYTTHTNHDGTWTMAGPIPLEPESHFHLHFICRAVMDTVLQSGKYDISGWRARTSLNSDSIKWREETEKKTRLEAIRRKI
jgi:hypothetical protein